MGGLGGALCPIDLGWGTSCPMDVGSGGAMPCGCAFGGEGVLCPMDLGSGVSMTHGCGSWGVGGWVCAPRMLVWGLCAPWMWVRGGSLTPLSPHRHHPLRGTGDGTLSAPRRGQPHSGVGPTAGWALHGAMLGPCGAGESCNLLERVIYLGGGGVNPHVLVMMSSVASWRWGSSVVSW